MNVKRTIWIMGCAGLLGLSGVVAQPRFALTLSECRNMALSHSEDLQQADNKLQQAALDRKIVTTNYLPKFTGSATGTYMFPDFDMMGSELRMRGMYMAGITLTQPIYTGGKLNSGKKLAQIGANVASEQRRMTRMDVLVEADNAYWTYIAVGRKVRMLERYCAQMDTLYRQVQTALAAGLATDNDLLRIEAKRSTIRYQLQKGENGADLCRLSLCRIIGVPSETQIEPTDTTIVVTEAGNLTSDIADRPELNLLKNQIAANEQQIRMTRADMLPTVGLTAGYTYFGNIKLNSMVDAGGGMMVPFTQEFRDGIGVAMLAVQVPIFHWGEGRKKVRKARFELQNAELELQKNTRLLSLEVQQAIRNVQDGYLLIRTAEDGLREAEENLRVMRNRYAVAMAPLTDLLDAQSQWQEAESNLIEAQAQYKIYETEYLRAIGRLE